MGGTPITAMNVLAFHQGKFPVEAIQAMLKGAQDKAAEVGCIISGGHSIQDTELKYGLAVTGIVHPNEFWKNHTPRIGDILVLTKPLGTGCMSTALKKGHLPDPDLKLITNSMKTLNNVPVEIIKKFNLKVNACTDITGFGLAGHLSEMVCENGITANLFLDKIPVFSNVFNFISNPAYLPGGFYSNKLYIEEQVEFGANVSEEQAGILYDPQTSGGLLFSMPETDAKQFLDEINGVYSQKVSIIGSIAEGGPYKIRLNG